MSGKEYPIEFLKEDGDSYWITHIEESDMMRVNKEEIIFGAVRLVSEHQDDGYDSMRKIAKKEGIVKVRIEALDFEMEIGSAIDAAEKDLQEYMQAEMLKNQQEKERADPTP